MSDHHDTGRHIPQHGPRSTGDLAFSVIIALGSLFLLSRLGEQTEWVGRVPLAKQPGFWPGLSLAGMTVCALVYLVGTWRAPGWRHRERGMLAEMGLWVRSAEFALWLMAYVFATPWAGYLPASVAFCVLLSLRAGYRDRRVLGGMALFGVAVVVVFKSLLRVSIPGGALYELFPEAIRNFLIVNF